MCEGVDVNRKLVVFVPREALDRVRTALFDAGAGRIGEYEHCSFDVVRAAEVVTLLEHELPVDSRLGPFLDHIGERGERFVHLDRNGRVGPLLGRRPGHHFEGRHDASLPRAGTHQT